MSASQERAEMSRDQIAEVARAMHVSGSLRAAANAALADTGHIAQTGRDAEHLVAKAALEARIGSALADMAENGAFKLDMSAYPDKAPSEIAAGIVRAIATRLLID